MVVVDLDGELAINAGVIGMVSAMAGERTVERERRGSRMGRRASGRGGETQQQGVSSLSTRGRGAPAMRAQGGGTAAWRQCRRHCGGDEVFPETPPAPFSLFTKRSNSSLVKLIEAPGKFYKMCQNSHRLHLTF